MRLSHLPTGTACGVDVYVLVVTVLLLELEDLGSNPDFVIYSVTLENYLVSVNLSFLICGSGRRMSIS